MFFLWISPVRKHPQFDINGIAFQMDTRTVKRTCVKMKGVRQLRPNYRFTEATQIKNNYEAAKVCDR